ncbi:MAG: LamG domain-containing protein, partial [Candidatus Veblenbacteria bacterium]|nr:LamG domain-containing protein [Candidatus Veblenbacteria bacterium]
SMTYQSAGKVGKSILFDEVDDYYTVGDFNYGDSFTVSMWLKVTDNVGTIHKYLFSHDTVDTNPSLNILVIEDSASAPTGGPDDMAVIMRANTSGDEAMLVDTPTDTNVTDGSWHYVTVTRTQSGTNYTYVNGVSQVSSSATANAFDPAGAINIARREDGTSDRYFDGNLDEIRIANTPRSAEWVEADYLFTNDSSKYTYASEEASAPFVILGTFTPTTSTISYRSTSATNIVPTTYYNLDSKPASGSPTHAIGTGTLNVANNFTVGDGTNAVTVNATTSDPGITVTGTFTVAASATFVASDSASFTLKGNFTNNGTFTNSSGTVTYQPTSESPVVIGGSTATTFHNFTSTIPSGLQNITLQFKASQAAGFAGTLTLTGQ